MRIAHLRSWTPEGARREATYIARSGPPGSISGGAAGLSGNFRIHAPKAAEGTLTGDWLSSFPAPTLVSSAA